MSSSRMPLFLLGGINITYNFLGSRTARTAAYGLFEVAVKLTPMMILFGATGNKLRARTLTEVVTEDQVPRCYVKRRTSLTQ